MLTLERFTGLNNVLPPERLQPNRKTGATPLREAMNCDVGLTLELLRREGFTELSDVCHKNVHEADGFLLATSDGGDLVAIADGAGPEDAEVLYPSIGTARMWYRNWPDGRVAFSNGSICGLTAGTAATTTRWGVPNPASLGAVTPVAGDLFAGDYRIALTHVRLLDGVEGGPIYGTPFALSAGAGITLTGLPTLAGHKTRVYLSTHNGGVFYRAGETSGSTFAFTGKNEDLQVICETEHCYVAPAGILPAFWRGQAFVAQGSILLASRPTRPELFRLHQDYFKFSGDITMVETVDAGIFVGTTKELAFLRYQGGEGRALADQFSYTQLLAESVVLGSGVRVPGRYLKRGDGSAGEGDCMACIAGGFITAGYQDGAAAVLQPDFKITASEVSATWRKRTGEIPQYIAIPQ